MRKIYVNGKKMSKRKYKTMVNNICEQDKTKRGKLLKGNNPSANSMMGLELRSKGELYLGNNRYLRRDLGNMGEKYIYNDCELEYKADLKPVNIKMFIKKKYAEKTNKPYSHLCF